MGIYDYDYRFDRKNWFETFSASLGHVFIRQVRFTQEISYGKDCDVDLENGTITFDGSEPLDIQILGKEDLKNGVWQWAFENFDKYDKKYLELANKIHDLGKKFGNEALREPSFNLDQIYNGHSLSTVACAIQEENYCYFKCDHPTGALFVAIKDLPEEIFEKVDVKQFMDITLDRIQHLAVNQKIFVESFLNINETPYKWDSTKKLVADFGENLLVVDFKPENGFFNISNIRITRDYSKDD